MTIAELWQDDFSFVAIAFKHGSATFVAFAADQRWIALVQRAAVWLSPKHKLSNERLCIVNVCVTGMSGNPQRSPRMESY